MHPNDKMERFSMAYIAAVAAHAGFHIAKPELDRDSIDGILLPLSIKNYDDLRRDCVVPRVLIVVALPANEEDWLDQSEDALILRHCGYWASLAGAPERENTASVTVPIPRHQRFDTTAVKALMAQAQEEQL